MYVLSLTTFLQQNGLLKKVGGIQVLIELISQAPNLIYLEDHLGLVKEKFFRRCLIKIGYEYDIYVQTLPFYVKLQLSKLV